MIYLDHNATSPLKPEVAEVLAPYFSGADWLANPSSLHRAGRRARGRLEEARESLAQSLGVEPKRVLFVSGGSEADNLALKGTWHHPRRPPERKRILVSPIEHPAVLEAALQLEAEGAVLDWLPVDATGQVQVDPIQFSRDLFLVSCQAVNHETGVIQPLAALFEASREAGALWHCDGVQAPSRIPIPKGAFGADLFALSAHKLGGPRGIGALVVDPDLALKPQILGGPQERSRRAGTQAVALALGFAKALEVCQAEAHLRDLADLDATLTESLGSIPGLILHAEGSPRAPGVRNFSIPGLKREDLLMNLDLAGFCLSAGSACASGALEVSPVLKAMGLPDPQLESALRVSLAASNLKAEVVSLGETLRTIQARLSPKGSP